MFAEGKNLSEMARILSIDASSIGAALKKWGLRTGKPRNKYTKERKEELIQKYRNGSTIQQLADAEDVTYSAMKENLENWGIDSFRRTGPTRVRTLSESFFKVIDTPAKAYWLGFIFADGTIAYQGAYKPTGVSISLAAVDKPHLTKFVNALGSDAPISDYITNSNHPAVRVAVCSSSLGRDLVDLGIRCNKTQHGGDPLPHVPSNLHSHFFRGYFDGDGWISHGYFGKTMTYSVNFGMVIHPAWFEPAQAAIIRQVRCLNRVVPIAKTNTTTVVQLQWSGGKQVRELIEWLYTDAHDGIWLDRKFTVVQEVLETGKFMKPGPVPML